MPVKNSEKFLSLTINSILNQTEKNWELIVVNDGSEDNSLKILQNFAEKDYRIKIFDNEEGSGIIHALKTAFKHSKGDLVTRMDSDDLMTAYKLEKMKEILLNHDKGNVVTGPIECFSDDGIKDGYRKYENWLNTLIINESCYSEIYRECVIQSSCWMVHSEDLKKCEAFDLDIYPEDYDLAFRFYKYGLKVRSYSELLHLWRDHPSRVSRNDPRYEDQQYFDLKLKYFFELDHDKSKVLVIWGTGSKGKKLVRKLQEQFEIPFRWVGNNPKKIGEKIYGVKVENYQVIKDIAEIQIIVTVSGPDDLKDIGQFFKENNFVQNEQYFYFC
ncbi:MAG: glycosyltransferase family 2 protein [Candidatus Delongbacteria bacterium]|nr:glycosyltransferase family 2 protein [Candidatus Delongbacteria bacterium]